MKKQPSKKPLRLEIDKVRTLRAREELDAVAGGLACGGTKTQQFNGYN